MSTDLLNSMNFALQLATRCACGDACAAQVHMARCLRTAGKNVIRVSNRVKRLVCRKCGTLQVTRPEMGLPVNTTVRVKKGRAIVSCANCGAIRRAQCPKPAARMRKRKTERRKRMRKTVKMTERKL